MQQLEEEKIMYNNKTIYDNLKTLLKIDIKEDKLKFYEAVANKKLDDDLKFIGIEESLVNYFETLELGNRSNISKKHTKEIKSSLGLKTIYEERTLFTKLFMRDYQSKINSLYALKEHVDICDLFRDFSSDELKEDLDFAKTIITLDGKYLSGMSAIVKNNKEIVSNAIDNDTSKDITSFVSAGNIPKKDSNLAIKYFKKIKENNKYISPVDTYNNIFKKDENNNFPTNIFKNNEQASWLEDNNLIVTLASLDYGFVKYITEGKISIEEANSNKKLVK